MPNSKKTTDVKEDKTKTTQDKDVVGTAANPKPPEAGSIGTKAGDKKVVDDLSTEDTNVAEGASVADGKARIGMNDGTVRPLDDVPPGTNVIGEDQPRGDADDREPSAVNKEGVLPSELNATPSTDPVISELFDPIQTSIPASRDEDKAVKVNGVEVGGQTPEDERLADVPVDLWPAVRACIDRIETARRGGFTGALEQARNDLNEALAVVDGGKGSKLRDWANGVTEEINKENDKAGRKEIRDAKKAADEAK